MSVIADIYYGDYNACRPTGKEDFKLEADKKRLDLRSEQFAKTLSKEQKKEFKLITNARKELNSRELYITFEKGISFGTEYIMEIYASNS